MVEISLKGDCWILCYNALCVSVRVCGSEGKSDGKMHREVSPDGWMIDGIMLAMCVVGGIDGFHTEVETDEEIVEVQSQSCSVGHSHLA